MDEFESLSHSKWECKYHVVFIPKYRRKVLYGELRNHLGEIFRKLATQRESRVEEGHLMPDHVHMMLSIPPKYAAMGSVEFSKLLLARAKVAVAPGLGFGEHGDGYVRIALVENNHRLRQAVRNIRGFLQAGSNAATAPEAELSEVAAQ